MSNLIKSNYIYVNGGKEIIDSDTSFQTLTRRAVPVQQEAKAEPDENGFTSGLNVVSMQKLIDEEQALIVQSAEQTMNDARKKAIDIVNQAKEEAEGIKALATEEGKKQGYVKGFEAGSAEIERLEKELKDKLIKQEEDYQALLKEVEPQFVDIMIGLIEKITSVAVEDQKSVILHLINRAITNQEKSNNFIIKVSKEDFEFVKSNSARLVESLNEEVQLQILEDASLTNNQCMIETNGHFIDCSLDIQLTNLIRDLKMLNL